ncbi:nickel pincer cofactor-dependent isomerase, group 22 [Desulfocurvus sp. DL9XJH121]
MDIPKIVRIRQALDRTTLEDPAGAAAEQIRDLLARKPVRPGAKVALTAGSRGIANIVPILRAVAQAFKDAGARPVIIPSMGSHGGAAAQGQVAVLAEVDITEETVGAPIESCMDTVVVGATEDGVPVHLDRTALECDHIVPINRIKPHTEFSGHIESGVSKMMVIGLGNKNGAETAHLYAVRYGYERILMTSARVILDNAPVLAGLGIIENGVGQTAQVALVEPENWFETEHELLESAHEKCPKLPFDPLDVLLVDESGKHISGTGMDTKVVGRIMNIYEKPLTSPRITRIVLRDLAKPNDGNVLGMGLADFITRKVADQINTFNTNINCVTAVTPEKGRMPIVCTNDRQALEYAMATAGPITPEGFRLAWIHNTSTLEEMWVSTALAEQSRSMPNIEILGGPQDIRFNEAGDFDVP